MTTKDQKTAIQQAEKQLEQERAEKLKNEIYSYLKGELEAIDSIDGKIRKLSEEKRAHEENVKNLKQGNLKAIEERRKNYNWTITRGDNYFLLGGGFTTTCGGSSSQFYSTNVAGTTITTTAGKTYIF